MASAVQSEFGPWTPAAIEARIVRYADLKPCYNAFIDTRSPGSEAKENFTIIGPGVSENPEQYVHITEPHGFNIGGARQPPGCVNSQHSHDTAEVFVVHSGEWRFDLGEHGDDAQVHIGPGDVISIPTQVFRGFTNVGADSGYLFAVLGEDNPGRVLWAPDVFEMASEYGLVLLETGQLIDTVAGQAVPADAIPMPVTSPDQIAQMKRVSQAEAEGFVWRSASSDTDGAIIGSGGPLNWHHGFELHRINMVSGMAFDASIRSAPEVVFVHQGQLSLSWSGGTVDLDAGDTMTIPPHVEIRMFSTPGCIAYAVERS